MIRKIQRYGWQPDLPDYRDFIWPRPMHLALSQLPVMVDLRDQMPAVYDQKDLGSCTANAIAGALQFDRMQQHLSDISVPSRLFIYYNERVLEGDPESDGGAQLRDGAKVVAAQGWCDETSWPYDTTQFAVKPSDALYQLALAHKALQYFSVNQDALHIQASLAQGFPVVFGFTVFQSFESDVVTQTGMVPLPTLADENWGPIGGHAVCIAGYDTSKKRSSDNLFIVRNSWGPTWGDAGYFYMPFQYALSPDLAQDFGLLDWHLK